MQHDINCVKEFMQKQRLTLGQPLNCEYNASLSWYAQKVAEAAKQFKSIMDHQGDGGDQRIVRAHLVCEECSEFLEAMSTGTEVDVLDALADLCYVVFGSALAFDLPLQQAFDEVHKSNMTKRVRSADDLRCRDKGESYETPNLTRVLEEYRNEKTCPRCNGRGLLFARQTVDVAGYTRCDQCGGTGKVEK